MMYSATNEENDVANTTPDIPQTNINITDKVKLIIVSHNAQIFVSLNNPAEVIKVVVGIFMIYINIYIAKDKAVKNCVCIFPLYQISIKAFIAKNNGMLIIIAIKNVRQQSSE